MTVYGTPDWLIELLGISECEEGRNLFLDNETFVMQNGILRAQLHASARQQQTKNTFGYKWQKRDSYESAASLSRMREWLVERYGDIANAPWWKDYGEFPIILDGGCGAAMSAIELFGHRLSSVRYIGADISEAVDVAAQRFREHGFSGGFLQADVTRIPLPDSSVDVIFSEGVLHHTDSTENALKVLSRLLKPGGRFLFYVYNKKGPIREFTDDYIRLQLQSMSPDEGWGAIKSLTKLGKVIGDLDIEIEVSEPIKILDIPSGKINLQRLFYWHFFKIFYRNDLSLEEMNHINFDWYAPANAHRQTPAEVNKWCSDAGLSVEREVVEPAGITIIARKDV